MTIPDSSMEDWRHVDCRPLADFSPGEDGIMVKYRPVQACDAAVFVDDQDFTDSMASVASCWHLEQIGTQQQDGRVELQGPSRLHIDALAGSTGRIALTNSGGASQIHVDAGPSSVIDLLLSDDHEDIGLVHITARLLRNAQLRILHHTHGGLLLRQRWDIDLLEAGASCHLAAAAPVSAGHQLHHCVRVCHHVGNTTSRQRFRAVAHDNARISFDGLITVLAGADGSDAQQSCAMIETGPTARCYARPQLGIHTDDVIASHGAAIGQLDQDQLRYLRSRGLAEEPAQKILIDGFLREAADCL